ncbi:RagB/SusD family nutrient uptake outer membrane protein [Weeksella virosa]|uniref:RagB/SusD domain-containing protein n=1 Tax=Weeksella virosa (strain ATCC 43766 / DSM 16922 / JCM 21250 / CCUG 30538 / CDC 9751 / IAM 14551 / NBRC 16016 / NCTC 11634 / CL345/78) TaxID=865938 RepID=F0P2Z0_WEEVC|nr:RagB/SusD family nutrient uptake outer membrane protein [Weeksella virosa]ADX67902.1 RagB/SusD domain-containing protein [Weeksella virosa DSM 16922]MDK7674503.1 RagB/SusD family nutrient uptake outer membrane protein [Weeksella virosa]VEH64471.1 SusD family [Weeksella virosa]
MKKILLGLFTVGAALSFTACSDDRLDLEPVIEDVYTGTIQDEKQMSWHVNQIYNSLAFGDNFGAAILLYGDMISENVFMSASNTSGYHQTLNNISWSGESGFGVWRGLYDVIQKANIVILDNNVPVTDKVVSYKGEAKIARGMAYFYLLQLYASNPTSGQYQEVGVPLVLDFYNPNHFPERSTVAQGYDQVIKDLTEGIAEMNANSRTKKTYLSPTAGRLLLAKAYLTRGQAGDYDKAIQYAEETINLAPASFELLKNEDVKNYFTSTKSDLYENRPETVFEIEQGPKFTLDINAHLGSFYSVQGGHRGLMVRKWVADLYDSSDVRLKETLSTGGAPVNDDPKGVWTKKYPRAMDGQNYHANVKVLRLSEALFVKMEALAKKGDNTQALALVNDFAQERGATSTYSGDALTAVLLEKQKEFLAEGHRFFDLKRNNLGFDKKTNCYQNCSFDANSRYMVFPISLSERLLNTSLSQHPLWQ